MSSTHYFPFEFDSIRKLPTSESYLSFFVDLITVKNEVQVVRGVLHHERSRSWIEGDYTTYSYNFSKDLIERLQLTRANLFK